MSRIAYRLLVAFILVGFFSCCVIKVNGLPPEAVSAIADGQDMDRSGIPGLTPVVSQPVFPADTTGLPPAPLIEVTSTNDATPGLVPGGWLLPRAGITSAGGFTDRLVQENLRPFAMPAPIVNFEGMGNRDNLLPPDTDGEVGRNHYVQMVNVSTAVYDKNGSLKYGPFHPNELWPVGDVCRLTNDGDVVALYDQLADRWLLSQFALPKFPSGPYYQCIAVSKTMTPTNIPSDWWPYTFMVSSNKMNDYPKLAVWPDGYYMTVNQFTNGQAWGGGGVYGFDRAKMLAGQAAAFQYVDLYPINASFGGMLPADLDGPKLPPAGSPAYFLEVDDNVGSPALGPDAMRIWKFHVDWMSPASSTFGLAGEPDSVLPVASFDLLPCVTSGSRNCIPQPSGAPRLDSLGDRLMFRAVYRNFGDHESIVLNHTVKADGTDRSGIRWYEVRSPGSSPSIYQQGTFAPADGHYRWMGSLAMDHVGNIGLGYSISSASLFPSIRYTGRLANDPLGIMSQGEGNIITGTGAQLHSSARWGDYSAMSIDPVDDCTFWYTQEYIQTTDQMKWQTRIASFKFLDCVSSQEGTLLGKISDAKTFNGIPEVLVQASTDGIGVASSKSGQDGSYSMTLPVGVYTVTASAPGYLPGTAVNVIIDQNKITTHDFSLNPGPPIRVSGKVTDARTGWPLYARLKVNDPSGSSTWTDPVTGVYSLDLKVGVTYNITVTTWVQGYLATVRTTGVLLSNQVIDIGMDADVVACIAPGYIINGSAGCQPMAGGLIVGNVFDGNTDSPLNNAQVSNDSGWSIASAATPLDPLLPDGFYTLFTPLGTHIFTTTMPGYADWHLSIAPVLSDTLRQDIYLEAGWLAYSPASLSVTVTVGMTATVPITLSNQGQVSLNFSISEVGVNGPSDVLWLKEAPSTGAIAAHSKQVIQVTLDGSQLGPGSYTAQLKFDHNTPYPIANLPIKMTLTPPPVFGVHLYSPINTRSGRAGETLQYTLIVTNTGNITDMVDLLVTGNSLGWKVTIPVQSLRLGPGKSSQVVAYVMIPSDGVIGTNAQIEVTALSRGDVTRLATVNLISKVIAKFYLPFIPRF